MRTPWPAVAAGVVISALGVVGLVRGEVPTSSAAPKPDAAPIVVTGAYVRPPLPPTHVAAAYFTVRNTTAQADVLDSVVTGAGASAQVHAVGADGSMSATGLRVPAHDAVTLSPGRGHVMIEGVYGTLRAGQTVNLELQFRNAGSVEVTAPVRPLIVGAHS